MGWDFFNGNGGLLSGNGLAKWDRTSLVGMRAY